MACTTRRISIIFNNPIKGAPYYQYEVRAMRDWMDGNELRQEDAYDTDVERATVQKMAVDAGMENAV